MLEVSGFGVRNLRALADTGIVDLRPINIFVGRNSAGKSSLARVLPLLKQSAERRKQAPLLWYGRLVDFGSFADAVSSFASPAEIELRLRFKGGPLHISSRRWYASRSAQPSESEVGDIDAVLTLVEGTEGRTQLKRLSLDVFGVAIEVVPGAGQGESLFVNGKAVGIPSEARLHWVQGVILPQLRVTMSDPAKLRVSDADFAAPRRRLRVGETEAIAAVSAFVHGNTLSESKLEIADRLPVANLAALHNSCKRLASVPDTWRSSMATISTTSSSFSALQRAVILLKLDALLAELDDALLGFCNGVSYLEPLRATAQRYYRREEISVDELDPKGLNTAFYFQGLTTREKESLNSWLHGTFGFSLSVKTERGHVALQIQSGDGEVTSRNMADVGLGYSQLAPVAIQLWAARQHRRVIAAVNKGRFAPVADGKDSSGALVVVEQPELHLHPAFQAKLADVFASCVMRDESEDNASGAGLPPMRLVAETHSPNLIGRLGELVGMGTLSAKDVNIIVFESDSNKPEATKLRFAEFNDDGVLQNWPIGFFDA